MNNKNITQKELDKKSTLASQIIIIVCFLCYSLFINDVIKLKLDWYLSIPLTFLFSIFLYTLIDFSHVVRIENSMLKSGIYHQFFGFVKLKKQFFLYNIQEIEIVQNQDKYFEIVAFSSDDQIIVKTMPNKNPAQEELERIRQLFKNYS